MNQAIGILTLFMAMQAVHVSSINDPYYVRVENELADVAGLRCQSKDDDLGYHNLQSGDEFGWRFKTDIWGSTLFWCDFWKDDGMYKTSGKVFWMGKIMERCHFDSEGSQCDWYIRDDGIYAKDFNQKPVRDVFYYTWGEVQFNVKVNHTRSFED